MLILLLKKKKILKIIAFDDAIGARYYGRFEFAKLQLIENLKQQ